jgi:hypothetical protein
MKIKPVFAGVNTFNDIARWSEPAMSNEIATTISTPMPAAFGSRKHKIPPRMRTTP